MLSEKTGCGWFSSGDSMITMYVFGPIDSCVYFSGDWRSDQNSLLLREKETQEL